MPRMRILNPVEADAFDLAAARCAGRLPERELLVQVLRQGAGRERLHLPGRAEPPLGIDGLMHNDVVKSDIHSSTGTTPCG